MSSEKENKEILEKYPFLLARNVWNDEVIKPEIPEITPDEMGWFKLFFYPLMDEIKAALIESGHMDTFRTDQVKEKFGELRWYTHGGNDKVSKIIDKYSMLSRNICIECGKPDVPYTNRGWIEPLCKECYSKRKYTHAPYEELFDMEDSKMADSYTVRRFTGNGTEDVVYDISDTANMLRERWIKMHE